MGGATGGLSGRGYMRLGRWEELQEASVGGGTGGWEGGRGYRRLGR